MKNSLKISITNAFIFLIIAHLSAQSSQPWDENTTKNPKHLNNVTIYGGVVLDLISSLGEVKNYYYYSKARLLFHDRFLLDGSVFYYEGGYSSVQKIAPATYYNAHFTIGKSSGLTLGIESGNRYFTTAKDSGSLAYYIFTNTNTGEKKYFRNAQINQYMTSYSFGFSFMSMTMKPNFWRAKGSSRAIIDFTLEALYAPQVKVDQTLEVSPYGLYATEVYSIDNLHVSHWGFRLLAECGGSSKLSFHQEIGLRPGITTQAPHTKSYLTSKIYISMGVSFCFGAGGNRFLQQ